MPPEREHDVDPLAPSEMGAPPSQSATAGRLNPHGIVYFYAAFNAETAIAEMRPWKGASVCVARFDTEAPLAVLDLTRTNVDSDSAKVRFASIMLGRPVHRHDPWAYLGSQYLAEAIKAKGLDGILYESSMRFGGINVALFRQEALSSHHVELHEVVDVQYTTVCHAQRSIA